VFLCCSGSPLVKNLLLNNIRKFLYYWFPIIIYCALIYFQSSRPAPETIPAIPYIDKLLHVVAYAVLGALFLRAFRTLKSKHPTLMMILSMLLSMLYGISDEIHQYFVPFRNAELPDVFANMVGSVLGVLLYWKLITNAGPKWVKLLD
jgi:VanZ family protein